MTDIPTTEPTAVSPEEAAAFQRMQADAVFTGRNMGAGAHLAGLLTAAQTATARTPQALMKDLWPGVDPAVVQDIYERGVEVGWRASQYYAAPRLYGEQLAMVQNQLAEVGHAAMEGMVARSRELARRGQHPAEGETAREH